MSTFAATIRTHIHNQVEFKPVVIALKDNGASVDPKTARGQARNRAE
jgi:hypothetical protein